MEAKELAILRSLGIRPIMCLSGRFTYEKGIRILFTCAFIELLISDNNANYALYLLIFFSARYKTRRVK